MTKNNITALGDNQIFVAGTNKNGAHAGGAARLAYEKFGLEWGFVEGLCGKTYAIPTLDENMRQIPLDDLKKSLETFIEVANQNKDNVFFFTDVGCGIAGRSIEELESILPPLPENINPTWK